MADQILNLKLDTLFRKITMKLMLNNEDVKKLIEAQQEIFPTREEIDKRFDGIKQDFSNLHTAIDAYAKK